MHYLPMFAELRERPVLVVGGGIVAWRRVQWLLRCQAQVTVIAPDIEPKLQSLADEGRVTILQRAFADDDMTPWWLVIAATDRPEVNAQVAAAAEAAKRFCNVVDAPALCTFIMPAIIDRDPVTIAVSSSGYSPVLARWIKGVIETTIPQRIGVFARFLFAARERVAARIPDSEQRRHFWQRVVSGDPANHAYAGRDAASAERFEAMLDASADSNTPTGEAWFVGAGPGDAGLITVRGRQLLAQADVILYDRLVNPGILEYARRDAQFISVGKEAGGKSTPQPEINRLLVEHVAAGKRVCRLKGGDPMVFARLAEELEALAQAGLPFQIVPGVSAVAGCAAYAGIPLTWRAVSQSLLMTTGHARVGGDVDLGSNPAQRTVALYMAGARHAATAQQLIAHGHAPHTPVAIIERGTLPDQHIFYSTLQDLADGNVAQPIGSPALLIVGDVVNVSRGLQWFAPDGSTSGARNTDTVV